MYSFAQQKMSKSQLPNYAAIAVPAADVGNTGSDYVNQGWICKTRKGASACRATAILLDTDRNLGAVYLLTASGRKM